MTLISAIVCVIFYLAANTVYGLHYKLKTNGNPLSKLVTGDRKKLDNKALWVKRYRAKVLVLLAVVLSVPFISYFSV
jgi:hypothetical protein